MTERNDAELAALLMDWVDAHPEIYRSTLVTEHVGRGPARWGVSIGSVDSVRLHARIADQSGPDRSVPIPLALLWAACVEASAETDVGACSCDPNLRSGGTRGGYRKRAGASRFAQLVRGRVCGTAGNYRVEWGPHAPCRGTGRVVAECARLVLEAAQPNPYARENLTVASDRAQAAGDPLGTWLALGLERWMVGQREGLGELADWLEQRTAERGEQKVSRGQ